MSGRWVVVWGCLFAAIAAGWQHANGSKSSARLPNAHATQSRQPHGPARPEQGRYYAVALDGEHQSIDLEFDGASHYELVVGSLGESARTYRVHLEARPITRVESFPVAPVGVPPSGRAGHSPVEWRTSTFAPSERNTLAISSTIPPEGGTTNAARRFFLHVTTDPLEDPGAYVPVEATVAGEGKEVRVYLDRHTPDSGLAVGLVDEIIRLLDDEIIPHSRTFLGEHADIDGDGKLAVLVTPWLGRLCGGKTSLNGFVRSNDFLAGIEAPFGNHGDIIYLNSKLSPGAALKTLLAHEYTHAVCFSRRLANPKRAPLADEEDWLNEAIAHVAENFHRSDWSNLNQRIASFLKAPGKSPLVVRDYYRAGLWRDPGCRGATYLFLRFCVNQFGESLLRDLVESPASGRKNLERATGVPFAEIFRNWTIAMAEGDIAPVPLRGPFGGLDLSGPTRTQWHVDESPIAIELSGTSATFVSIDHADTPRILRVSIEGDPGSRLQVTLVRHPKSMCDGLQPRMNADQPKYFRRQTAPGSSRGAMMATYP